MADALRQENAPTGTDKDGGGQATLGTQSIPWKDVHTVDLNVQRDVTISGNLTVDGATSTVEVVELHTEEPLVRVAKVNTADATDIGIYGATDTNADGTAKAETRYHGIIRDASDSKWKIFEKNTAAESSGTITLDANKEGTLRAKIDLPDAGNLTIAGTTVSATAAELNTVNGVTAGTGATGKALVLDGSGEIAGIAKLTATKLGAFQATGAIDFNDVNMDKVDIDSGAIDGVTIATSDITVGTGKTLNVSNATAFTTSPAQKLAILQGLAANADPDLGDNTLRAEQFISDVATSTAPFVVASTTKVANLNVDKLDGADWAEPAVLGSTTPAAVNATTLNATTSLGVTGTAQIDGDLTLNGKDGALTFGATGSSIKIQNSDATALVIEQADDAYLTFNTTGSGSVKTNKVLDAQIGITLKSGEIQNADIDTNTIALDKLVVVDKAKILVGPTGASAGSLVARSISGDVTLAYDGEVTINSDVVTYDKMQNLTTANRLLGVTGTTGLIAEVTINEDMIDADAVTYEKIQNVSVTDTLLGRKSSGAGVVEEIACTAQGRSLIAGVNPSAQRGTLGLGTVATLDVGIQDTNILQADSTVTDDDFLKVNGTKIEGRTAANVLSDIGAQPLDASLTSIAGLGTTGSRMIYTTAADTYAEATLTAAGRALLDDAGATAQRATLGLTIGSHVQAYDAELAALAGLTSAADKGIQFTGNGTAATYTLTAAGKALLDDADAAAQRVTLGVGTTQTPEFTGITLSGQSSNLNLNSQRVINLADPSVATDAANKKYVDEVAQGLEARPAVRVATTANITIADDLNISDNIDGIALADGDRVLVKNQTTASENGIYIAGTSPARAADMASGDHVKGHFFFVEEGTVNADNGFVCTSNADADTVGTHSLTFVQFSGAGQITAGSGLTKSGNTIRVGSLTASRALTSSASGELTASSITTAELELLDGITGDTVQTQLNAKQPLDGELTELATMASATAAALADLTAAEVQILDGATVSTGELNALASSGLTGSHMSNLAGLALNSVSGLATADFTKLAALDASAAELNLLSGPTGRTSTTIVDADGFILNDNTTMKTVSASDLLTYVESNITTVAGLTQVSTVTQGEWAATDIGVEHGGTGVSTLTDNAVMIGGGTGDIQFASATAGQILVGTTSSAPVFATLNADQGLVATQSSGGLKLDLDLKADGGCVFESNELAVDLSASGITGTLAVDDGGTGVTSIAANNILIGNTGGTGFEASAVLSATAGTAAADKALIAGTNQDIGNLGTVTATKLTDGTAELTSGSMQKLSTLKFGTSTATPDGLVSLGTDDDSQQTLNIQSGSNRSITLNSGNGTIHIDTNDSLKIHSGKLITKAIVRDTQVVTTSTTNQSTTIDSDTHYILVDAGHSGYTVNLTSPGSAVLGREVLVKNIGTEVVTVQIGSGISGELDVISGADTLSAGEVLRLVAVPTAGDYGKWCQI